MLKRIKICNYKSLKAVDVVLPSFMTIVGANAAGKSNFVDCLDFLSRCFRDGLSQAVGSKGGYENIAFRRVRRARGGLRFELELETDASGMWGNRRVGNHKSGPVRIMYSFAFKAHAESISSEYKVVEERFRCTWGDSAEDHWIAYDRSGGLRSSPDLDERILRWLPDQQVFQDVIGRVPVDELVVPGALLSYLAFWGAFRVMEHVGVYQISPRYAREPGDPSGRKVLGRLGTNLPAAVQHLKKADPKSFQSLLSRLKKISRNFTGIETDYVETKHLGLFLREKGVGRRWYVADLSDGTVQTIALFTALLDTRFGLVAIEEPENSLHPWVISEFVEAARDQARKRQVILTTHSPYLVANLKPEELFLAERESGETHIISATTVDPDMELVIREGLMDLGEYWNSGQMSAVPGGESLQTLAQRSSEGV